MVFLMVAFFFPECCCGWRKRRNGELPGGEGGAGEAEWGEEISGTTRKKVQSAARRRGWMEKRARKGDEMRDEMKCD